MRSKVKLGDIHPYLRNTKISCYLITKSVPMIKFTMLSACFTGTFGLFIVGNANQSGTLTLTRSIQVFNTMTQKLKQLNGIKPSFILIN